MLGYGLWTRAMPILLLNLGIITQIMYLDGQIKLKMKKKRLFKVTGGEI